jgi:hypothetical protein
MMCIKLVFEGFKDKPHQQEVILCANQQVVDYWVKRYTEAGWLSHWACWSHIFEMSDIEESE